MGAPAPAAENAQQPPTSTQPAVGAAELTDLAQRLVQDPQNSALRVRLARAHAQHAAWADAARVLLPVAKRLNAEDTVLAADALRLSGDPARSAALLEAGLTRFPRHEPLWLAWIDAALEQKQFATALQRVNAARRSVPPTPALCFRAAQAYFEMGQVLGAAEVRHVADGRAGQFVNQHLLVEQRDGGQRFLCSPAASALYQLRRALDGGLDTPAAHVLHARIWHSAGRFRTGFAILKNREAMLLESAGDREGMLAVFCELALSADALVDFLRYSRMRTTLRPQERQSILGHAYLAVAQRYNERGEEALYLEFGRRALEYGAGDATLLLRLADSDWSAGRCGEAAGFYRRVLALEPTHIDRQRILERLAADP
ncbi:MAG: hypothetical protein KKB50_06420 [Planctomycetes bacterium]|nr:hypothetical protein [Planctomycetota bacterium]